MGMVSRILCCFLVIVMQDNMISKDLGFQKKAIISIFEAGLSIDHVYKMVDSIF